MNDNVITFPDASDEYRKDARAVLEDALTQEFEAILIVGIGAGRNISLRTSKLDSIIEVLGCIELLKDQLLRAE